MSIFFELCATFVSWSVRSALHVSTRLCLWEASSLKKKQFSNYISHIGRRLFRFSAKVFQHGNQNRIRFQVFNRIYAVVLRTSLQFFWLVCQNCTLRVHSLVFMGSILFEKKHFSNSFTHFRQKIFRFSSFFPITVVRNALVSKFLIRYMPIFCGVHAKLYWSVCQNCTLRVHTVVFMGSIFFEKNTFPIVFHILGGNFSGFWAKLFQRGSGNSIGFQVFQSDFCQIFRSSRKTVLIGLSELHSTCPQDCFHGKHLLWKKNTFQIIFRILDGHFSDFRQKFPSTVVRTALDSRFLIGFMPTFSDFTQEKFDRSVRTELYVSTGLFSWVASSLN